MTVGNREFKMIGSGQQLPMAEVVSVKHTDASLIKDLFPRIKKGTSIRPKLDADDLELIRDGLIELMNVKGELGSGSECVQLMRRILRRA